MKNNTWKTNSDPYDTANVIKDNQNKIISLWNSIIYMLPPEPRSYDVNDDPGFWTNGDEILCPSEAEMNVLYEFLSDLFSEFGSINLITGWYDPYEDIKNDETDNCTGFNYIRIE